MTPLTSGLFLIDDESPRIDCWLAAEIDNTHQQYHHSLAMMRSHHHSSVAQPPVGQPNSVLGNYVLYVSNLLARFRHAHHQSSQQQQQQQQQQV